LLLINSYIKEMIILQASMDELLKYVPTDTRNM